MKKLCTLFIFIMLSILPVFSSGGTIVSYTIDPEKNAYDHNNKGLLYMEEKYYYAAIQEFKIAISLNPKTQATAVYFNNLGRVYMEIGYPQLALDCFRNAMTQYNLNFEFYKNLCECYKQLGMTEQELARYKKTHDYNHLDKIMLGLLYEQLGDKRKAIIVLDEFVMTEPELLITPAVKYHIKTIIEDIHE